MKAVNLTFGEAPFSGLGRRRANGFFAAAGLVLSLMLLRRRFVPAYLLNFVVGGCVRQAAGPAHDLCFPPGGLRLKRRAV